jgi:hypothetical protein
VKDSKFGCEAGEATECKDGGGGGTPEPPVVLCTPEDIDECDLTGPFPCPAEYFPGVVCNEDGTAWGPCQCIEGF